jgi:hypothetical protein
LVLAIAGVGAGCSSQHANRRSASTSSVGPREPAPSSAGPTTPATTPATAPTLPAVTRWQPGAGELVPAAKEAAVRRVERLGNDADHRVEVIDAQ